MAPLPRKQLVQEYEKPGKIDVATVQNRVYHVYRRAWLELRLGRHLDSDVI